jgi:CRP-like cAMP-binding protein
MRNRGAPQSELHQHPLFRGADAQRYAHLLPYIGHHEASRGTLLHQPNCAEGLFHLVLRGRLQTYILGPGGRQLVLELIQAGGFDGILPVAGHRGHYTEVVEDAILASMELRTLERLTWADNTIGVNLLRLVTTRLEQREEHLETIALYQAPARLARQLLALGQAVGAPRGDSSVLRRPITHQMMADMLGLRRETVTIHLQRLVELGAVRFEGGAYRLDHRLLEQVAGALHFDVTLLGRSGNASRVRRGIGRCD